MSPFDNLLSGYGFATRVLGFEHVIEMYKPAPQRRYGYYVLPSSGAIGSSGARI